MEKELWHVLQGVAVTAVGVVVGVQLNRVLVNVSGHKYLPSAAIILTGSYGAAKFPNRLMSKFSLGVAGGGTLVLAANSIVANGIKMSELPKRN